MLLPMVVVYRDCAFVDRNTGSRKGHRSWFSICQTGSWYQQSALESFMRAKYPAELRQDWVSYAGTGHDLFGGKSYAHGDPGPMWQLLPVLDLYCTNASVAEQHRMYEVLSSGDRKRVQQFADTICMSLMDGSDRKTEPDGAANGSQPIRLETNSTSSTAGSRR